MKKLCALLVLSLLFLSLGWAQSSDTTTRLSTFLQYLHSKRGFSGELLVAQGHQLILHHAVGDAHREPSVPASPGQVYRIASITKPLTAALVLQAQQEGRLDLDAPIGIYLPTLAEAWQEITPRQLLNHTAGMPHWEGIPDYWPHWSHQSISIEQGLALIGEMRPLAAPGGEFHYSSPGYFLLGCVMEVLYGMPFDALVAEYAQAHGLENTQGVVAGQVSPQLATGYHRLPTDSVVLAPHRDYSLLKGAGNLQSTAQDLWQWLRHTTPNIESEGSGYAMGWYVQQEPRLRLHHGGGTWGYNSYLAFYPGSEITVVLLSNVSTLPMTEFGETLEKIVFEGLEVSTPESTDAAAEAPARELVVGLYRSEGGHQLRLSEHQNQLVAQMQGNPPFVLTPEGGGYASQLVGIHIEFITDEDQVTGLVAHRMGQEFWFVKD